MIWLYYAGAAVVAAVLSACSNEEEVVGDACYKPEDLAKYPPPPKTTYYPVVVHQVRAPDDNGSPLSRAKIDTMLAEMNAAFGDKQINVQFFHAQAPRFIDSSELLNKEKVGWEDFKPYLAQGALNVFVTDAVGGGAGGFGVFGEGFVANRGLSGKGWIHEMGHVFGLHHPHDETAQEAPTKELVDGSNALEAGDRDPSTPADPGPQGARLIPGQKDGCVVDADTCEIVSCPTDSQGNEFKPDVRLYMSYYPDTCQDRFSPLQTQRMQCIQSSLPVFGLLARPSPTPLNEPQSVTVGCDESSYGSIGEAMQSVPLGGRIEVCNGRYEGPFRIDAPVTLAGREGHTVILTDSDPGIPTLSIHADASLRNLSVQNGIGEGVGGIFVGAAHVIMRNMNICQNRAVNGNGGGILASRASLDIEDTVICENEAQIQGGGIFLRESSLVGSRLRILKNRADFGGGGLVMGAGSSSLVGNTLFEGNITPSVGGGALMTMSSGHFYNTGFEGNSADRGSALFVFLGGEVLLENAGIVGSGETPMSGSEVDLLATDAPVVFRARDVFWQSSAPVAIRLTRSDEAFEYPVINPDWGSRLVCSTETLACSPE